MPLSQDQIAIAVEWWTRVLQTPNYEGVKPDKIPNMKVQFFRVALRKILSDWDPEIWEICVDNHPCALLSEALKMAELVDMNFSIKASMLFQDGNVFVFSKGQKMMEVKYPELIEELYKKKP